MASRANFSVVIDVGTSKLAALAGRKYEEGKFEVLAKAVVPSKGIKRGTVLNIDEAASAVTQVLDKLEHQLDEEITSVNIAYAGQPVKIYNFSAGRMTSGEGMVTQKDVDELLREAEHVKVEAGYQILHVVPQSYIIDGEITDLMPVSVTGKKIEANYKLFCVPEEHLSNFRRVVEQAGIKLEEVVLSPVAAGEAVLTEEEKELGAVMLDLGAGTSKLAVYNEGALIHTAVIPFGGEVVTRDIKEGCSILLKWAEQLKVQYGQALGDFTDERKVVTIPGHNGWEPKEISFKSLAFIIQARMEEIVDCLNYQIEQTGIADQLGLGIVLTGGTARLNHLVSLVKFRTGMDTRLAHPVFKPHNLPNGKEVEDYLVALGQLKMVLEKVEPVSKTTKKKPRRKRESGLSPWLKTVVQGVLDYVDDEDDVALK